MAYRTEIDLNKMSERSRLYYLEDLIKDLTECVKDLTKDSIQYGYIKHIVEHGEQAASDLNKLLNK
jgi:hypothetical protein